MTPLDLRTRLEKAGAASALCDLCESLMGTAPQEVDFDSDLWNVLSWSIRPRHAMTLNLKFSWIVEPLLNLVAKVWVLHSRLTQRIDPGAAKLRLSALNALSAARQGATRQIPNTADFERAELWLTQHYGEGTAYRTAGTLQLLSDWANRQFRWRIRYQNKLSNPTVSGRYGTEKGRSDALVPLEVIRDLIAANLRQDLSEKDSFFLSGFTINVGAGFRIEEFATLPADCLIKEGGVLSIRYFPEKGGPPVPRPIHPALWSVVEEALKKITDATQQGRLLARKMRAEKALNWALIVKDIEALQYFAAIWAHDWSAAPEHRLFDGKGTWSTALNKWVDAVEILRACNGNKSAAARQLGVNRLTFDAYLKSQIAVQSRTLPMVVNFEDRGAPRNSWDTDTRVISFMQLEKHAGVALKPKVRAALRHIMDSARDNQMKGCVFPKPGLNQALETKFREIGGVVIRDKFNKPRLLVEDALLVIEKYAFAKKRGKKLIPVVITAAVISHWLSGTRRSRGTGNDEDSVFARLNIMDPRTGKTAELTWHDIRHWLNTVYESGGLTEQQIAMIFGRKSTRSNAVYDQTSNKTRMERVQNGIRGNMIAGRKTDTYHRLATISREQAEEYLAASTRMINPMPHGLCLLDWSRTPCPHHLSCFSEGTEQTDEITEPKPCEHLVIDSESQAQRLEVERIHREAGLTVAMLGHQCGSPQLKHFEHIHRNTATIIASFKEA